MTISITCEGGNTSKTPLLQIFFEGHFLILRPISILAFSSCQYPDIMKMTSYERRTNEHIFLLDWRNKFNWNSFFKKKILFALRMAAQCWCVIQFCFANIMPGTILSHLFLTPFCHVTSVIQRLHPSHPPRSQ